jgi:hypothetical protein
VLLILKTPSQHRLVMVRGAGKNGGPFAVHFSVYKNYTSLAISESYRLNGKNAKYDLVIATSQFLKSFGCIAGTLQ